MPKLRAELLLPPTSASLTPGCSAGAVGMPGRYEGGEDSSEGSLGPEGGASLDFQGRLILEVREAVREEHRQLQEDLQRRQQQNQLQLTNRLLAQQGLLIRSTLGAELRRLLGEGDGAEGGSSDHVVAVSPELGSDRKDSEFRGRSRHRHHTWHHRGAAPSSPMDLSPISVKSQTAAGSSTGPAAAPLTPRRRAALLQLPVGSRRMTGWTPSDVPTMPTPSSPAPSPSEASPAPAVAEYCRPLEAGGGDEEAPHRSASRSQGLVRQDTEIQSHFRNEENEKWRRQWKSQLRNRLSKRLARKSRASSAVSLPDFFSTDLMKHRSCFKQQEPTSRLERLVDGHPFQVLCSLVILANAVFIGVATDSAIKNAMESPPQEDPMWFGLVNQLFVGFFILEIIIRLFAKRWKFFFGEEWKWNLFDCVLAVYSVIEELLQGFVMTYARLLRGIRLVRVLRVIRVMRFFRELRLMVCSIIQSLVSLAWAGALLLVIMYIFTICFMHGLTVYLHDMAEGELKTSKVTSVLQELYGSIGNAMFSLLMAISGGVDWIVLVEPLAEVSWVYQVLFAFYVLFVLIGVLNVLTSVFVERANELSRLDRDLVIQSEMVSNEAFLNEMQAIFQEVDAHCTGKITWQDFHEYLQNEHVQAYFATQQLDTSDARELFNLLDVDQNEEVTVEEFVMGCMHLRGQAKSSDVATLLRENRKASQKNMRVMRKLETLLRNILKDVKDFSGGECSGLPSPTSYLSGICSPSRRRVASASREPETRV